ncbi:MAG TPA: hypothetical protein VK811_08180 [Candidatus Acidoferrum sp.]|jgi:hypothetical protein|nr:hypothetical protein [Candidatus Acidoferrum sp.]
MGLPATRLSQGAVFIFLLLLLGVPGMANATSLEETNGPRIVNIYNFIRNSDFRVPDSEDVLFDCTRHQINLLKEAGLPATWALQYDALINPRYQKLLKDELSTNDEIAAWWEIPQSLTEKAGLEWRGRHEWDPSANAGFSPGYTPEERRKLVDVYMAEFKKVFGRYPRTVGSWYIDEVTLAYMSKRYGIIASCNCKDQIGTDFYTLWGGYWNQAYYPSRLNAYMPAQTRRGQIDVPIFRMLGSDPIYQHGTTPGLISLEPVYKDGGGGMPRWVDWFMNNLISQPCLAFGYTQAGQENSFGWEAMQEGLTYQASLLAALAKTGKIRIETLAQSGQWFRDHFSVTPPTAVVALDDWKNEGHKTVWYDSRFYRLNIFWDKDSFFIRDLHRFDQRIVSPTHNTALKETSLAYETLPIADWAFWSNSGRQRAGMWPILLRVDGSASPMQPDGQPIIKELNSTDLRIDQPVRGGRSISFVCRESEVQITTLDSAGKSAQWACDLIGGAGLKSVLKQVSASAVTFNHLGEEYQLKAKIGSCRQLDDGNVRLLPNKSGILVLTF